MFSNPLHALGPEGFGGGRNLCFGGSRRRWIIKNIVLEGSRRPGSRKLMFWRPPGGVGSTKIVFWRLPEGCQFGDNPQRAAQQPAEESFQNSLLFCIERVTYQELPQNNAKFKKKGLSNKRARGARPFCRPFFLHFALFWGNSW